MKFSEIPYERVDAEALMAAIDDIAERFENAKSGKEQLDLLYELQQTQKHFESMSCVAYVRHTINTNDEFYDAEKNYYDEMGPLISEKLQRISLAMVNSPYRAELEAVGFTYTCLRNTVRVDSIPSGIESGAVPDMLAAIAEQLKSGVDTAMLTRDILFEKALYQASCKAAIKAGRDYPEEHIKWLVDKLMEIPDITFCPHGRPVAMEMKKRNIDHQFERC